MRMSSDRGHGDRRSELAAASKGASMSISTRRKHLIDFESRMRRRAARGYDLFVKSNFHSGLEGESTFAKRKVLDQRWAALTAAEKAVYRQQAEAHNEEAEKHDDEDYVQFVDRHRGVEMKNRKTTRYLNERLRAVQHTIRNMMNHAVFSSGTEMFDFDKGIKPPLVRVDATQSQIAADYKELFGYDFKPVPNPADLSFFKSCRLRCGGFCESDQLIDHAATLTHNRYSMSASGNWKADFPIILELAIGNLNGYVMLGRVVGRGELSFFSKCVFVPQSAGHPWNCCDLEMVMVGDRPTSIPITSHKYFVKMLEDAAALSDDPNADPSNIEEVQLRRWNFVRETHARHFRARLVDVHTETSLSCKERIGARKRTAETLNDGMLPFGLRLAPPARSDKRALPLESRLREISDMSHPPSEDLASASEADDEEPLVVHEEAADHDGDVAESDVLPEPEPWNAKGIKSYEVTPPRARAVCMICGSKIAQGLWRLDYRSKVSDSLSDQKRVHVTCAASLPVDTRVRDRAVVESWLRAPGIDHVTAVALESLLESLR